MTAPKQVLVDLDRPSKTIAWLAAEHKVPRSFLVGLFIVFASRSLPAGALAGAVWIVGMVLLMWSPPGWRRRTTNRRLLLLGAFFFVMGAAVALAAT